MQNKSNLYEDINKCPAIILMVLVLSSVLMNLFANKEVSFPIEILALDCGVVCSGMTFLCMDSLVQLYGLKYANKILVFSVVCNLIVSVLFFIVGVIPGYWGRSIGLPNSESVNIAINETLKGNWFVLAGSTFAFVVSGVINNFINQFLGDKIHDEGIQFSKFAIRNYISTFVGQIIDNLVFSFIVSRILFKWGIIECITCSTITAIIELLFEVILSPIGYMIVKYEKVSKKN